MDERDCGGDKGSDSLGRAEGAAERGAVPALRRTPEFGLPTAARSPCTQAATQIVYHFSLQRLSLMVNLAALAGVLLALGLPSASALTLLPSESRVHARASLQSANSNSTTLSKKQIEHIQSQLNKHATLRSVQVEGIHVRVPRSAARLRAWLGQGAQHAPQDRG